MIEEEKEQKKEEKAAMEAQRLKKAVLRERVLLRTRRT